MEQENNELSFNVDKNITYIFEGVFESENIVKAINFLDESSSGINFFINTPGGYVSYIYPLLSALEEHQNVILHPIEECSSAGFLLLLKTYLPIKLMDKSIRCLVHFPRIDSLIDLNKNHIYPKEEFSKKQQDNEFVTLLKNLPIDKKTKNKLIKGEDVILYYNDLLTIFNDRIVK